MLGREERIRDERFASIVARIAKFERGLKAEFRKHPTAFLVERAPERA